MQYLVALKALKDNGYEPTRTILLSYVPDEEIGGLDGMSLLLQSNWFNSIKVDVALDEGLACPEDDYCIFYGERMPWWISFVAKGNTGHASRFIEGTAVEQAIAIANKATTFRTEQKEMLHGKGHNHHAGCSHAIAAKKKTLGDVTSLNITVMRASVTNNGVDAINVIPDTAELIADIRVPPHIPLEDMADTLTEWCQEVTQKTPNLPPNGGVTWSLVNNTPKKHHVTSCDPAKNPWYNIFLQTIQSQCGIKLQPSVFPAATDSRFLRAFGVKALGFSPMRRSPVLLHEHDEYLGKDIFVEGCEIYIRLIRNLTVSSEFDEYVDPDTIDQGAASSAGLGCPFNPEDFEDDDEEGTTLPEAPVGSASRSSAEALTQAPSSAQPKAPARCPYGHG
jgi:aminoacylase